MLNGHERLRKQPSRHGSLCRQSLDTGCTIKTRLGEMDKSVQPWCHQAMDSQSGEGSGNTNRDYTECPGQGRRGMLLPTMGKIYFPPITYPWEPGALRSRWRPRPTSPLKRLPRIEKCEPKDIFEFIAIKKEKATALSTAITVFTVQYFMDAATPEGHRKAGHGSLINQSQMSSSELVKIGQLLYGESWKTEVARHLGV